MRVIVVGLGSMGKRRIRILRELDEKHICGVDTSQDRRMQAKAEYGVDVFGQLDQAIAQWKPEAAFVCCPPLHHRAVIERALHCALHVFTELNLVTDGYPQLLSLAKEKRRILFLSSTFNYRKDIQFIQNSVSRSGYNSVYSYHSGQYLPDWHPWENYRDFFVSEKRTNAVREILAIELPWLVKAFGSIHEAKAICGNVSGLDLAFPDYCMMLLTHENGNQGTLFADVASRKPMRRFEAIGEGMHILWDGRPETLFSYSGSNLQMEPIATYHEESEHIGGYSPLILENAYAEEIRVFFQSIQGQGEPLYTFEEDFEVLRWIDRIEAMVQGT